MRDEHGWSVHGLDAATWRCERAGRAEWPDGQISSNPCNGAWALGTWLQRGAGKRRHHAWIMHALCVLYAFCTCSTLPCTWNTPLGTPQMAGTEAAIRFCVLCCMFQAKNRTFSAPSEHPFMHALCVPFRLSRLTLSFDVLHRTIHAVWPCESVFVLCVPCALLDASVCAVPMNAFCCLARGNDGIPDPVTHALCVPFDVPHDPRSACAVGCESVFVPCVPCAPLHASVCSVPLNTTCCLARGNEGIPDPVMSSLRAVR